MSGSAIELAGVARRIQQPDSGIVSALENFHLSVVLGEFCAIVRPTGYGKPTTLGLLSEPARLPLDTQALVGFACRMRQ
jgi:NitT/TauT family transport system ATP-binding protein